MAGFDGWRADDLWAQGPGVAPIDGLRFQAAAPSSGLALAVPSAISFAEPDALSDLGGEKDRPAAPREKGGFDPGEIAESPDVPGDTTTTVTLSIGSSVIGTISPQFDYDYYKVTLTAGTTYLFTLNGSGSPALSDPYLELFDATGTLVRDNDDVALGNLNSQLRYTAPTSGTYYIAAEPFFDETGQYTLTASVAPPQNPLNAINWGAQLASNNVTIYFAHAGETWAGEVADRDWTVSEKAAAMAAAQTWANVANLSFSETATSAGATWVVELSALANAAAFMISPGETGAGIGVFDETQFTWTTQGLLPGGFSFDVLIHEMGHALGLAHPHDTGGYSEILDGVTASSGSYGNFSLNQGVFTVMSYNDGWPLAPWGPTSGINTGNASTPMPLDIALVQQKYGAASVHGGGDTYALSGAAGSFIALWDSGGTDAIAYGGAGAATIDLRPASLQSATGGGGYVSYVYGINSGYIIPSGVVIENATGGSGADTLIGNSSANILNGGAGVDSMTGGLGNDTYVVDNTADTIVELTGQGSDILQVSAASYTLNADVETITMLAGAVTFTGNEIDNTITGNSVNNTVNGNAGIDFVYGLGGDDTLNGGSEGDALFGGDNNDTLDGGTGADYMDGGLGNDTFCVDNAGDNPIEASGQGTDIIYSSVDYATPLNIEQLTLTGTALYGVGNAQDNIIWGDLQNNELQGLDGNDTLQGNDGTDLLYGQNGDDYLQGDNGNDALLGSIGNDRLDGGAGADYMAGGADNDIYYVDNGGDNPIELNGEGSDTIYATVSCAMTPYTEILYIMGSVLYGVGNAQDDVIFGNGANNELQGLDGNDTLHGDIGIDLLYGQNGNDILLGEADGDALIGGAGDDSLDGGAGADYMAGGADNDTYYVDNFGDNPIENSGEGNDVIYASVSYAMTLNVETMYITGSTPYGVGNAQANTIFGNAAVNELQGLDGNDVLHGGDGDDLLYGQNNDDQLFGENNNDALIGGAGNDTLDGGTGVDYLLGGDGNDIYYVDNIGDNPIELTGEGTDTIHASVSYTMTANTEVLYLDGAVANGVGNNTDDTIYGNAASNNIQGLGGADTLVGGGGTDFLYGGTGADTFLYQAASDAAPATLDAIMDFEIGIDKVDLRAVRTGGSDTFSFTIDSGNTFLHVDLGGDGSEDMLINIFAVTGVTVGDVLWS